MCIVLSLTTAETRKHSLNQGSQSQLTRGPLEVESGSGWAALSIPQKKGFTYSKKRSTTYPIFSICIINSSSTWMFLLYINGWTPPEAVTRLSMVAQVIKKLIKVWQDSAKRCFWEQRAGRTNTKLWCQVGGHKISSCGPQLAPGPRVWDPWSKCYFYI